MSTNEIKNLQKIQDFAAWLQSHETDLSYAEIGQLESLVNKVKQKKDIKGGGLFAKG